VYQLYQLDINPGNVTVTTGNNVQTETCYGSPKNDKISTTEESFNIKQVA